MATDSRLTADRDRDDLRNGPGVERLRWQCRRGMLELDLLLEGFLDHGYAALGPDEKRIFTRMLQFEDQLLLDWLMGYVVPAEEGIGRVLKKILNSN